MLKRNNIICTHISIHTLMAAECQLYTNYTIIVYEISKDHNKYFPAMI